MTLKDLKTGESAVITNVGGFGALRQHFLDMGVIPGAEVTVVKFAPMGDPMELQIHGYELTLRLADAGQIEISPIKERTNPHKHVTRIYETEHPGLGEGKIKGKQTPARKDVGASDTDDIKDPGTSSVSPSDKKKKPSGSLGHLTFALVGNQNSGKTTLFNQLTGANQHVGNFPGVTVDRKDGAIKGHPDTVVTDLPGIYSMSPYSSEEVVSRNFVIDEKPNAIINIVDATNVERNLYLTMQLLEMNVPTVIALNMMDEVTGNNGAIDINGMEKLLGVPVVPISAAKNEGVRELAEHVLYVARHDERPKKQDFCSRDNHGGAIHRAIHAVEAVIEDHVEAANLPLRFAATKMIEGDSLIKDALKLDPNEEEMIEHIAAQMEKESKMDRRAAIADMRFDFIEYVCERTVQKPGLSKERARSEKIDRVLTGKWTAIPCFIIIMAAVFFLTFNVIGAFLQRILASGIDAAAQAVDTLLSSAHVAGALRSLVMDGIFKGVGSVLSFLPIVVTLFFFLSVMEDSGYVARVAFFMDKLLRKIGLSGRSIVPMLIGFGCTVPAVMATRTLPSRRDRMMTVLLTPFMSCSAKLPIYSFFVNAFFPGKGGLIMTGLYVLGIAVGILVALLFKGTLFKGEAVPFVMELPNYRMPGIKNVARLLWDKAKDFLSRAFSVILLATIAVWFLQSFDVRLRMVSDSKDSLMAAIAGFIAPVFKPLGLGDWRIVTSLISGFMAKESVVATMGILFEGGVRSALSVSSAATMLVFSLLYTPCVASVTAIGRELNKKWAFGVIVWQCLIAWAVAFITHMIVA